MPVASIRLDQANSQRAAVVCAGLLAAACATTTGQVEYDTRTDPTGCSVEQITTAAFDEYQVQGVSRDGRYLAYSFNQGDDAQGNPILGSYTLDLLSGERAALAGQMNNSGSFSPNGRYLVAAVNDEHGRTEIIELDRRSGDTRIIASAPAAWDWLPSYSPDGRSVVFNTSRVDNQMDVYIVDRESGVLRRLTDYDGYDAHAQFSPDGQRVLFHRMLSTRKGGGYNFDIYVIDLASGQETRLTDGPNEESYAAFAPDGQHIVLSSDFEEKPEKHNLYVRAPNGQLTALTDSDWQDRYAYWTADGNYIYFNSDRGGIANVYRIPMLGFDCRR